jgi:hypothetical protein
MSTWKCPSPSLSNGGSVHIARKCDLTQLLAAADSDQQEVFCEFLETLLWSLQFKMFITFKTGQQVAQLHDR